ncbi:hypothetical protein ES703_97004 [subsurface metagenome]
MKKARKNARRYENLGSADKIMKLAAAGDKDALAILRATLNGTPLKNAKSFREPGDPTGDAIHNSKIYSYDYLLAPKSEPKLKPKSFFESFFDLSAAELLSLMESEPLCNPDAIGLSPKLLSKLSEKK